MFPLEFNSLVDIANRGLTLNKVDVDVLSPALTVVEGNAKRLRDHLNAKNRLDLVANTGLGDALEEWLLNLVNLISNDWTKGWAKLRQDKDRSVKYAIDDLNRVRWPEWRSIKIR